MKKYDTYKDSGVEWIGEIPKHWTLKPLKHIVECNRESLPENTPKNQLINYIEIGDVSADKGISGFEKYEFEKAPSRARRIVKEGDVIISTVRTYLKAIASIERQFNNYVASTGFAVLTPKKLDSSYLNNIALTNGFIGEIISLSKGVSYPSITYSDLLNIQVPFPTSLEQKDIGACLDQKTAEIDTLIAKKEQLIKLLEEERTAMINQAVTKGLDPNVPMKDSGIDWLGEIPEHWKLNRIGFLSSKVGDGLHGTPNYVDESTYAFINGNNIGEGKIVFSEKTKFVSELEYLNNKKELSDNTILMSINGTIGNLAFYAGETIMLGKSAAYINLLPEINKEFIYYYLKSKTALDYINRELSGSTIKNLSLYSINKTPVPFPSKVEQKEIVLFIKLESENINTIISKTQQEIDLLKEYKTALISEVVTGKIDVRDSFIPPKN